MAAKTPWKIEPVLLTDAPALARNSMTAFWEGSPTWKLVWPKGITLDFIIGQHTKRGPNSLLSGRSVYRHQKAVDPETGKLVGYARWVLPNVKATAAGGQAAWVEAQTADVSGAEKNKFEKSSCEAWWEPSQAMNRLDDKNHQIEQRIMAVKPYLKLDYIAVHPENKGKGIATALVRSGMKAAEELGIDVYVMSFEAGRPVYEKLGFRTVDENVEDDSEFGGSGRYAVTFMVYEIGNGAK